MTVRRAAVVVLVLGLAAGITLMAIHGRVATSAVDCLPPPGYTGGGYQCYTIGHPLAVVGLPIILVTLLTFGVLWRRGSRAGDRR